MIRIEVNDPLLFNPGPYYTCSTDEFERCLSLHKGNFLILTKDIYSCDILEFLPSRSALPLKVENKIIIFKIT